MPSQTGVLLTGETKWYRVILRFIALLFKSVWLFFPAILFIVLAIWCFWTLGQGKDVIVAFAENTRAKIFFFLAIALWAYVSWFSSRIVAYQKQYKQFRYIEKITGQHGLAGSERHKRSFKYDLPVLWLEMFPRLLGFACFLAVEMALLQSKYYGAPNLSSGWAWALFGLLLLAYLVFNKRITNIADYYRRRVKRVFYFLLILFAVLAAATTWARVKNLVLLFGLVVLLHIVYVLYIHLRHGRIINRQHELRQEAAEPQRQGWLRRLLYRLMDLVLVPRTEAGYFLWFALVALAGITVYIFAIVRLDVAVKIGPFPLALLAFSVLLGFGNVLVIASVRTGVNWHVIVLLTAFFLGKETHYVRTQQQAQHRRGIYKQRQPVLEYFNYWIKDSARGRLIDSSRSQYNMYFVMANGGASRSGYWTAAVLGRLEDSTRGKDGWFSRHLFCLSGASGGSVGNATFFALLDSTNKLQAKGVAPTSFTKGATSYLANDFLSYTLARMLGPDYFKYIFHFSWLDRAGALENSLEEIIYTDTAALLPNLKTSFANVLAIRKQPSRLPIICLNVTRMQDGNPGVVSNVRLDGINFNNRVDVLELLPDTMDIRLSTATILGARFPFVSPAGRIDQLRDSTIRPHYFVDGGYFDNSGAGVVQEMIRLINNYARTSKDPVIRARAAKLRFVILHITNSPPGSAVLEVVKPLTNDLAAPLKTVIGAYDMQTTVNDRRLVSFLADIDSLGPAKATYLPIHLYKQFSELPLDSATGKRMKEDAYPMNWFISDTMRHRMDRRLLQHPELNQLIKAIAN